MRRQVLLVADDAELIASVQMMLQVQGYQLLVASDHATAQQMVLVFQPQVVIIDLNLPEGAGRELARTLRQLKSTISQPVILLADHPTQADYQFAFAQGVDKFLTKPIRHMELTHAVDELVERCRLQQA